MNKSKIEWTDYTWNPVTGCRHGCSYCYARRIAQRFAKANKTVHQIFAEEFNEPVMDVHELHDPVYVSGAIDPYPFEFEPTFHRYRLEEPAKKTKAARIFVSSMGDLFGDWVPTTWLYAVLGACTDAPWHTYLFLTKNPKRYEGFCWPKRDRWIGTSISNQKDADSRIPYMVTPKLNATVRTVRFLSIEPFLGAITLPESYLRIHDGWVIIGAQTGPGAVLPKPEWVQSIIDQCRAARIPVFLKDNLNWPEKIQDYPEVKQ